MGWGGIFNIAVSNFAQSAIILKRGPALIPRVLTGCEPVTPWGSIFGYLLINQTNKRDAQSVGSFHVNSRRHIAVRAAQAELDAKTHSPAPLG